MGSLYLVRHGESTWNKHNWFTGWVDVSLTPKGIEEALACGRELASVSFDVAYTSTLVRAMETLLLVLAFQSKTPVVVSHKGKQKRWARIYSEEAASRILPVYTDWHLNERYYGHLQGLNKDETRRLYGEEKFTLWRRSYDVPPPGGESLQMTAKRTIPFFQRVIVPLVQSGKNVIISAHGNSLRSIVMYLDGLSADEVVKLEIPHATPLVYEWKNNWRRER
ncbi:histidine phosphatase family protein [Thermospira aquatica]|uniref:histidine phosphatase family protein n=1 Tax=Thermospira aquatica TaxID=2828656 RepID=UPI002302E586|nr:histidine phosphatase family protein [Thermospira aquatica]